MNKAVKDALYLIAGVVIAINVVICTVMFWIHVNRYIEFNMSVYEQSVIDGKGRG